jgi:hypothetical protein
MSRHETVFLAERLSQGCGRQPGRAKQATEDTHGETIETKKSARSPDLRGSGYRDPDRRGLNCAGGNAVVVIIIV